MISRGDLEIAVAELLDGAPTYQTCSKLADLYIILDHIKPGYSEKVAQQETKKVAHRETESKFMQAISGKDIGDIMSVMDELMEATEVLNPRLYENVLIRINEL